MPEHTDEQDYRLLVTVKVHSLRNWDDTELVNNEIAMVLANGT